MDKFFEFWYRYICPKNVPLQTCAFVGVGLGTILVWITKIIIWIF